VVPRLWFWLPLSSILSGVACGEDGPVAAKLEAKTEALA